MRIIYHVAYDPLWFLKDLPKDCMEALIYGMTRSGVTKIKPSPEMEPKVKAWCRESYATLLCLPFPLSENSSQHS